MKSNVLCAVGVRVRFMYRPSRHSREFWFWLHSEAMIVGSYMKGGWVSTRDNGGKVAVFNLYKLCYQMNWSRFPPSHVGSSSLALRHEVRSFHAFVNQFTRPRLSHVCIGAWDWCSTRALGSGRIERIPCLITYMYKDRTILQLVTW